VVRLWPYESGNFERQLKNIKKASSFCPICNPKHKTTFMQKEEVKEGALVCIYVDGRPHINTVVEQFPIQRGPARGDRYALLEGMGDPFPIKDLKPFNKGYRNTDELLTSEEWQ
jgi:hypothetical protein